MYDLSRVVQQVMARALRKAVAALTWYRYHFMPLFILKVAYKHTCLQYADPRLVKEHTGIEMFSTVFSRPLQRSTSEIKRTHGTPWLET